VVKADIKTSIVIAVLDSHKAVERQLKFFNSMDLPDDIEIILVDDGSDPPLKNFLYSEYRPQNLRVLRHDLDAEWTQPAARNFGVRQSRGEYLILTDIDHILTKELILYVHSGQYDYMQFDREVAILNEDGNFVQDEESAFEYGYQKKRYRDGGFKIAKHVNSFGVKKDVYWKAGGVSEHLCGTGEYPNREEKHFRYRCSKWGEKGTIRVCPEDERPIIYMFPCGKYAGDVDHNPYGLFHTLSRKTPQNRQWKWQQAGRFDDK